MKALLVEDDPLLGQGLHNALKQHKVPAEWVTTAAEAQAALRSSDFDVLVLDLGLPDQDGIELLRTLRNNGQQLPVLILTARDGISERVKGLDTGADDFLAKPFDIDELMARLRALVRRSSGIATPTITLGNIEIIPSHHRVELSGQEVPLNRHEYQLLTLLASSPGRVFSREAIIDHLYSWDEEIESNTIEVHVHHLRRKFGRELIGTVRGIGYRLVTPESR
ncbi:Two-component system response regulator QseB [Marinobacterium lacunae]|uniref:Two-component system response regulator QseB n=1 Tax=Marinobacterium lacunae TaxID=1232683 RepID=A0A081FWW3_9GAMM|nr:response regulator [Marinobacterium lacunae]KEA63018.1 Two-component system response regulator QseB [Marinobacterium lacunae]MBR9883074.1 response regulator [Oceanospirillales bacterium]